jgi:archaeal flagellin FlaB
MDYTPIFEEAFTGLEAAIVLIAFVVVAATFSYVILGAGFFTSQTAQQTVHTGVAQASTSLEVVGNIYGVASGNGASNLDYVNMTVALTAGGTSLDLDQMVISYNDGSTRWTNLTLDTTADCSATLTGNNPRWCVAQKINNVTAGDVLEPNAQIILAVSTPATTTMDSRFTVNLQPSVGAMLPVTRTVPASIHRVQALN